MTKISEESDKRRARAIGFVINGALVLVAIAAWASDRYPDMRIAITSGALALGIFACFFALHIAVRSSADDVLSLAPEKSQEAETSTPTAELPSLISDEAFRELIAKTANHEDVYWRVIKHLQSTARHTIHEPRNSASEGFAFTMNVVNLLINDSGSKGSTMAANPAPKTDVVLLPEFQGELPDLTGRNLH